MNAPWTAGLTAPWVQGADGAWRYRPDGTVGLSATDDTDDDLTPAERERLDASPEWAQFVAAEVADIVARHGLT